jgi:hypothetical protein
VPETAAYGKIRVDLGVAQFEAATFTATAKVASFDANGLIHTKPKASALVIIRLSCVGA